MVFKLHHFSFNDVLTCDALTHNIETASLCQLIYVKDLTLYTKVVFICFICLWQTMFIFCTEIRTP